MGKSLPRMCLACGKKLKGDFNKHTKLVCRPKNGFKGWQFFDRNGKKACTDKLPTRLTRIEDASEGIKIGARVGPPLDEGARAWRRIKRGSILGAQSRTVRSNAFKHFAKLLLADKKRFTKKTLFRLIAEVAEEQSD